MPYADYAYYSGTYHGTVISLDAFAALARRASSFIDRITYNRLNTGWAVTDAVKMATCAVAEAMKASEAIELTATYATAVKSENTDGRSVTYQDTGNIREVIKTQWAEEAEQYLLFTGLMDRSVGNACKR